ncbi:MAG: zinc-binding dehydrogenase [Anaerocolumna sp.]
MDTFHNYCVRFIAQGKADLIEENFEVKELQSHQVFGRTVVSLISSGSERGGYMDYSGGAVYPVETGYAVVMEVLKVGKLVTGAVPGDIVFASAPHCLYNMVNDDNIVQVLPGLTAEEAVLCRFPAVSMTTLLQTRIKPVEPVIVTGLGIVGLMCAQVFHHCGYTVYGVDPSEGRREVAKMCGLKHLYAAVKDCPVKGHIGLAVECSGAEQAAVDLLDVLRKGGELSLVGVPWYRGTDTYAHEIFHKIFYGFVTLMSGWEWSIPLHSADFMPGSNYGNYEAGMKWIKDGGIKVADIYETVEPKDCDTVYQAIVNGTCSKTCTIFDWRNIVGKA